MFIHLQVSVESLRTKQEENEVEVRGPPLLKAYDHLGNPTKVSLGFHHLNLKSFMLKNIILVINIFCSTNHCNY